MTQEEKLRKWYDSIASKYDTWGNREGEVSVVPASEELKAFKRLLSKIKIKIPWDVFEVAVGTGNFLSAVAPFAKSLSGIDISPKMVDVSKKKLSSCNLPVNIQVSSATLLPKFEKYHDIVIAMGLFEYYPLNVVSKILFEMKKISKKDSILIVDFPIISHPAFEKFKSAEKSVGHLVYAYSSEELTRFFNSMELIVIYKKDVGMETQYLLKKK